MERRLGTKGEAAFLCMLLVAVEGGGEAEIRRGGGGGFVGESREDKLAEAVDALVSVDLDDWVAQLAGVWRRRGEVR